MSDRTPVTMRKVAERAGVSMMTVSLALRGDASGARISEETRRRVLEVARDLRYRPNARGRALRSGVTNVIGLYAGYGYVNVRLPFFTEIVSGLQEGCEQYRKDLLLHGVFHGATPEDIYTELADGRIDGLVIHTPADDPLAARLADSHLPVVAVTDPLPNVPSVAVEDAVGSRRLARHLAERGYRRFAYLTGEISPVSATRRRAAFLEAAAECGMAEDVIPATESAREGNAFLKALAAAPDGRGARTAVVCWNDHTAYGVLADCRRYGIRVPEDVGVAGFDGCPTPYDGVWSLTTVRAPWAAVARTAVQYLNDILEGRDVPPETVLPVELIPGHTT